LKQRSVYEPGPTTGLAASVREVKGRSRAGRRLFVLDTNVLMHDPTSIFRFEEHDVYLPMVVLEELDAHKKGTSEASRNVRQVSRFLDDMMRDATKEQIDLGLKLPSGYSGNHGKKPSSGRLFFQTRQLEGALPASLPGQGGAAGVGFQAAASAAPAQHRGSAFHRDVPDVAGGAVRAPVQLPVREDAGPDPGADLHEDEIAGAAGQAGPLLADRHRVHVVVDDDEEAEPLGEPVAYREVVPARHDGR